VVRMRAVEALGYLQLSAAVPVLRRAVSDKDAAVRIRATETLGHLLARDFE